MQSSRPQCNGKMRICGSLPSAESAQQRPGRQADASGAASAANDKADLPLDFGDYWEHQLTLTKPRAADPGLAYPATSAVKTRRRRKIAAASPVSMQKSKLSPSQTTRITTIRKTGLATSIQTASTNSPSRIGSPASPNAVDQHRNANSGDQVTLTQVVAERCHRPNRDAVKSSDSVAPPPDPTPVLSASGTSPIRPRWWWRIRRKYA